MQRLIKSAAALSIRFLRFAIKYYTRAPWHRAVEAVTRPPVIELDEMLDVLKDKTTDEQISQYDSLWI